MTILITHVLIPHTLPSTLLPLPNPVYQDIWEIHSQALSRALEVKRWRKAEQDTWHPLLSSTSIQVCNHTHRKIKEAKNLEQMRCWQNAYIATLKFSLKFEVKLNSKIYISLLLSWCLAWDMQSLQILSLPLFCTLEWYWCSVFFFFYFFVFCCI